MLLLDVDHFKLINDSHGHAVGDAMLGRLGQAVASTIRASDVAARIGGEEFAVLAQHTPLQGARVLAERLRDTIETTSAGVLGPEKRVTVSIGVAQLGDETGPELLARTDKALYQAKHGGRNCVRVAGEVEHPQRDVP
jgi:diguanylate cyclase (GGDEF)-like protein